MFTTIITDCKGENEAGGQIARFNSLGLGLTDLVGVDSSLGSDATIQTGANLVDILNATQGQKGVVFVNVAPRGNKKMAQTAPLLSTFIIKIPLSFPR